MRSIKSIKLIILSLMFGLFSLAFGEGDYFVVGMELEFPPFETIDHRGEPSGVSVDMAKALGEHLGKKVKIENISYAGLIPALTSGKIDAIISCMTINDTRKKRVDFSIPYTTPMMAMLIHKDHAETIKTGKDLNRSDIIISSKTGTIGALWAMENAPKAQVRNFDKESTAVLDVAQGKSHVFLYSPLAIDRHHKRNSDSTVAILNAIQDLNGWGIAVRKNQPELLKKIDEFVENSKVNGTFDSLREKYLKDEAREYQEVTGMNFYF